MTTTTENCQVSASKAAKAYAIDLKLVCGGHAYFSTHSEFCSFQADRYEVRKPRRVLAAEFSKDLSMLGMEFVFVDSDKSYRDWLYLHGWALVSDKFCQVRMAQWLKQRGCLQSPVGSYTDLKLASPRVLTRTYRGRLKHEILKRDGNKCVWCGAKDALTMQHLVPFSMGGETISQNLATLCADCNQAFGADMSYELCKRAGVPHHVAPHLLSRAPVSSEVWWCARNISDNLMHTRCEIW